MHVVWTVTALWAVFHFHNVLNASRSNYSKPVTQNASIRSVSIYSIACAQLVPSCREAIALVPLTQLDAMNALVHCINHHGSS